MGKKFRNFVLFSAVVGAAAAGVYYFLQNKKSSEDDFSDDMDDLDDLDVETDTEEKERSYVPLDLDGVKTEPKSEDVSTEANTSEEVVYDEATSQQVEEFFDDEDTSSDPS